MERPVLFLQSLFIILVAGHVAYACSCWSFTLEESLCPECNKTVLMAKVSRATLTDIYGNTTKDPNARHKRYNMRLQTLFKNGTTPLHMTNKTFHMTFPRADNFCGREFNGGDSYVFTGTVDRLGVFKSNICQVIIPKEVAENNATIMDTLQGKHALNCTDVSKLRTIC